MNPVVIVVFMDIVIIVFVRNVLKKTFIDTPVIGIVGIVAFVFLHKKIGSLVGLLFFIIC